ASRPGLVSAAWRRKLVSGDRLVLQGRWHGGEGRASQEGRQGGGRLLITGVGTGLDSGNIRGIRGRESDTAIELGTVPAQVGRAVYHFIALSGKDTLEKEDIPVEVTAGMPLKILLLASSPGFENNFLSRWLADNGHAVASRTTIS